MSSIQRAKASRIETSPRTGSGRGGAISSAPGRQGGRIMAAGGMAGSMTGGLLAQEIKNSSRDRTIQTGVCDMGQFLLCL